MSTDREHAPAAAARGSAPARGKARAWWLHAVLLLGIAGFAVLHLSAVAERSARRSERDRLVREAGALYAAFTSYNDRHGSFPRSHGEDGLKLESLEPLLRRGYYKGSLPDGLVDARLDGYESPVADEFWAEMTAASKPGVRLVVARSDDAPLGGGAWLEGVYVYEDHRLRRY